MTNAEKYLKDGAGDRDFAKALSNYIADGGRKIIDREDIRAETLYFLTDEAKPILTEDERVILRNATLGDELPEMIARDDWGRLYLKNKNDTKRWSLWAFCHLFQFIKERRRIRDKRIVRRV